MTLKDAITLALDFERKVRDHYFRFAKAIEDPQGRRVFEMLGAEEQGHVDYLEFCHSEWMKSGKVPNVPIKSVLPKGKTWIGEAQKKLQARPGKRTAAANEIEALKMALQYEKDADGFYRKFVAELPETDRAMFTKFLEIEDGHLELVQAQLDSVQGSGFWFDTMEFRLELE
ncbi:MAG: ferritin family protein [Anaeromyxobacteraceae bacterium]